MNGSQAQTASYRVALVRWSRDGSGIGDAIFHALRQLGHEPFYFSLHTKVTVPVDVVFLFGPFGHFLPALGDLRAAFHDQQPTVVFWNTEGLPDLRLPWPVMASLSATRSWLSRLRAAYAIQPHTDSLLSKFDTYMIRFRHLGDFRYAYQQGWIDVFADISAVYAGMFRSKGIPALVAPFGGSQEWYADLNLTRDIDVLWMGKRATNRRSALIDQVRNQLLRHGVNMYVVDNEERPFVFDEERTHLLNRTKITLNLLRTWYDENSLRICLAAANRSLVISEPLLPHVPPYQSGRHYVTSPVAKLADTILYYLEHEQERQQIAEQGHQLVTSQLTMENSVRTIMDEVCRKRDTGYGIQETGNRKRV
ncbi:MAG: glycosyltransferase [Chloroflexota bacterium]|nr:glycosyltransferase [Chloroflexota bacterium]